MKTTSRFVSVVGFICLTGNLFGDVIDLVPERGRAAASVHWSDETGRAHQFSDYAGYPVILLPIYTRCRTACVQNVSRLKETLLDSSIDLRQSRVLLFSFDPSDTPATLAKFRLNENIPLGWSVGATTQSEIDTLLDSIGVQVGKAGTEFTHPNILLFLDSKLRITKWIYGTDYTKSDIDQGLQVATGQSDWIGRHSEVLYALLLFGASILCVVIVNQVRELRQRQRAASETNFRHGLTRMKHG